MPATQPRDSFPSNLHDQWKKPGSVWPLLAAELLLVGIVLVVLTVALQKTDGHLGYPVDDAYIHLAIAKNLVEYGVWGINSDTFSSASSSILWPLLLAVVFQLTGVHESVPLILNLLFGMLTLVAAHVWLLNVFKLKPHHNFLILTTLIFLTNLPVLMLIGMEHTLQTLAILSFAGLATWMVSRPTSRNQIIALTCLAALTTSIRFEGLFAIAVIAGLYVVSRRFILSALVLMGGLIPVTIFGLSSLLNGAMILPNSVFLKGASVDFESASALLRFFGGKGFLRLLTFDPPWMTCVFALTVAVLAWHVLRKKQPLLEDTKSMYLLAFLGVTVLHLTYAEVDWFFRYESYLMAWGILGPLAVGFSWWNGPWDDKAYRVRLAALLLVGLLLDPAAIRGVYALQLTPSAIKNIYEQQYQMGLFIRHNYAGRAVAVNDIGAVSFLGESTVVDLTGLGDNKTARLLRDQGTLDVPELVEQSNVAIAVVYEHWFGEAGQPRIRIPAKLPTNWTKIGTWKIQENVVCNSDTVSWFAVRPSKIDHLKQSLLSYASSLPGTVEQKLMSGMPEE